MRLPLALALVAACGSTSPVAVTSLMSAPGPQQLPLHERQAVRVMSYNVNFGLAGDPQGADAIALAAPDVVFLQETNEAWEALLVERLPGFAHHRFTPPHDWPAGGMGVMSRYPISALDELGSVAGPFFAWRVVLDVAGARVQILAVHLHPPMSDGGSWVVGYFSTREDRERELAWHAARLDPKLPTLIVGDFNEETDGLAVRTAEQLGYTDAISQFAGKTRTWSWPVGDLTLQFQLDHVMYDQRFVAAAAGIVEAGRSDHKPVWADLEITN